MGGVAWPKEDIEALVTHYPKGGSPAVLKHLKIKRGASSISNQARRLGVTKNRQYRRQEMTPQLLRELNAAYAAGKKGAIKAVADKHGVETGWLKYQARSRGMVRTAKHHRWQPEANEILRNCEGLSPSQARRHLSRAGYFYPLSAVACRMQQLHVSTECTDAMAMAHVAEALNVDDRAVRRWVDLGKLRTYRRDNCEGKPHAYTWIRHRDLREFIANHPGEIDLRRVQPAYQPWLIDVLTNTKGDI